jgi:hypothetical protein
MGYGPLARRLLLVALLGRGTLGRACPLCPGTSDINLLGDRQGVVDLDREITHCALYLGVTKQ